MAISTTSLLFCEGVSEDPTSRNVTVSGIYTAIRVDRLPSAEVGVVVYALLRGQPEEEGHLRLTVVEPQSANEIEVSNRDVIIGRNGFLHVAVRLPQIKFQSAGLHDYILYSGAVAIGRNGLIVKH
jgi:hypothetical protein